MGNMDDEDIDLTFSLRQATQAVILRVMSGGLRSPNASLIAMADDPAAVASAIVNQGVANVMTEFGRMRGFGPRAIDHIKYPSCLSGSP